MSVNTTLNKYAEMLFGKFLQDKTMSENKEKSGREGLIPPLSSSNKGEGHSNTPLSPFDETIITFYSDRNINQRMEFKNPLVKAHYELIEKQQQILKKIKHIKHKGQEYER